MSNQFRSVEEAFVRLNSPIPQAQPEQLAAIARVRGMTPCDVERAAVLEIGCGSGSNLLPLAERYPHARLLGLDDAPDKIAAAQRTAAEAGLGNIEFRCEAIGQTSAGGETFDYIIVPDVYSWVDEATRNALLVLCQRSLAPYGVAYINYNVNPGWRLHDMLGGMMRFAARGATTAAQQLAAGRGLLEFARATLPADDDGYGSYLVATVESILRQPDGALIRNYLQGPSHAVYYPEFEARAGRHELQVLGDAGVGIRVTDFLSADDERRLEDLTDDPAEKERMRDVMHNTAHRQSVLCRAGVPLDFALGAWRLRGLYLEGRIETKDQPVLIDSSDAITFVSRQGHSVTTPAPTVKAAISHLAEQWPRRIEFSALVGYVRDRAASAGLPLPVQEEQRLEERLLQCCVGGLLQVHGEPQPFAPAPSERPRVSALTRLQAARSDVVTSRRHLPVRLDPLDRYVLAQLDGTRDLSQLVAHLAASAASGKIALWEEGQNVPPERAEAFIQQELNASLARMAEHALLVE